MTRTSAQLLSHLPSGEVLDTLALECGRDAVLDNGGAVARLSGSVLDTLTKRASAGDTCTLASFSVDPDYLERLWKADRRVTVRRTIGANPHISAGLRRLICAQSDDSETIETVLVSTPREDLLPLLADCPDTLKRTSLMFRSFIRRIGAALAEHPIDAWLDIAHSFNYGTQALAAAVAYTTLEVEDLLELARAMDSAQLGSDSVRETIATELRTHGEDALKAAWYELGWAELGRELVKENPASIPMEQAAQLLTADELVNVYMGSGQPLTDELVNLLAQTKFTAKLGIVPLTDAQVKRLYVPADPYSARTSQLLNWIWSCCTPRQRVEIIEANPSAVKRHGRSNITQFKNLIEAGLNVTSPSSWELLDPLGRHDWSAEPSVRRALVDYGPVEKYMRIDLTPDEKVRLIERAEEGTISADYVADRVTGDDNLGTEHRTRLLIAWAHTTSANFPRWVTPEDLVSVRTFSAEAAERLIAVATGEAYSSITVSGAALLVPHAPLDWARVRDSYVWQLSAKYLTTELGNDTDLWRTTTALLENWHGSLEELVRFARSVN